MMILERRGATNEQAKAKWQSWDMIPRRTVMWSVDREQRKIQGAVSYGCKSMNDRGGEGSRRKLGGKAKRGFGLGFRI